jgi:hypothetical protein
MAGRQSAVAPSASELRQEARLILDQLAVTASREERRRLAVRAFELVQLAERLMQDREQRRRGRKRGKVDS